MSCGRVCKTNPCTFPACTSDATRRVLDAIEADPIKQYTDGYSDGYDDALRDTGDGVTWYVMAAVWVWGALIGAAATWAWL